MFSYLEFSMEHGCCILFDKLFMEILKGSREVLHIGQSLNHLTANGLNTLLLLSAAALTHTNIH